MSAERHPWVRTTGWGPFSMPGEQRRLQKAEREIETLMKQIRNEGPKADSSVKRSADEMTDLLVALQRSVEAVRDSELADADEVQDRLEQTDFLPKQGSAERPWRRYYSPRDIPESERTTRPGDSSTG